MKILCIGAHQDDNEFRVGGITQKWVKAGYEARFARTASRFRKELIAHYGEEKGKKIRYAEAFQLCEYGAQPSEELTNKLFYL